MHPVNGDYSDGRAANAVANRRVGGSRVRSRVLGLSLVLLLMMRGLIAAEQTPPQLTLTVEGAVERGLKLGQEVRIAESQSRETRTQTDIARSLVLPSINAQSDYTRSLTPLQLSLPPGLSFGGLPFGQVNTYNFGLVFGQPLYHPGAIRGIRIAEDYFRSAKDQETETRLDLVLNICQAYYGAVLAERLAEIAQVQIDQLDAQLKDIRLQRQAGNASDLDVSRVEVNRENIEPQKVDALNARDQALLLLKRLVNVDVHTDLTLADQLTAENFQPISDAEIGDLMNAAVQRRAAVRAAQRLTRIRAAEIKQAKAAYLPSLDFFSRLNEQAFPQTTLPMRSDYQDDWSVGFRLSMPLFDGGQRWANVRAAKERLKQADLQLELLLETVQSNTEESRLRLKRAADLIVTRLRASQKAVRVYDLTDLAYLQGTATYLDVTDARTNLRQARANEVQAVHDYYVAYLQLIRTVGVSPEDFARAQSLSSHKPTAASPVNPPDSSNK
ncbi:MAG: TolC family protein [Limisphaerales bacterium]